MTRKHFKEIARILGENNASISIIREFMNFCMEQNDNFNRTTFLDAVKKHSIEKAAIVLIRQLGYEFKHEEISI